jgi:hypothetical protein
MHVMYMHKILVLKSSIRFSVWLSLSFLSLITVKEITSYETLSSFYFILSTCCTNILIMQWAFAHSYAHELCHHRNC